MLISDLDIPDRFKDFYIESGIKKLYPPQAKTVEEGLLDGENILAAIPTASGKTLLAELAMIKGFKSKKKSLYIVPLRALASEKFRRFSQFEKYGVSVGISTGDFDKSDEYLGAHDWIVATSEKVDSLFRNETTWLSQISVVVIDEIHLLDSANRGPTLEIVITKLRQINPKIHIVALSATVGNAKEIASWLNAKPIISEWRPTELKEGILIDDEIVFVQKESKKKETKKIDTSKVGREKAIALATDIINEGGQCLVFDSSRKNTMSFCKKVANFVKKQLSDEDLFILGEIAFEITEQSDTELSSALAFCIKNGAAFHHAGLSSFQRDYVEQGFLNGYIKVIVATPTLAAGLNLPARRVVIRSYRRYESNFGMLPIPVLDYKQMAGRAGRPHLDPYGESVLLASNEDEFEFLKEQFINAKSENIISKLATETALRTHILATVSNGFAQNKEELLKFFKQTFFAYQEGMTSTIALNTIITKCLHYLIENDMLYIKNEKEDEKEENKKENKNEFMSADLIYKISEEEKKYSVSNNTKNPKSHEKKIYPTNIGFLVSKLYIDPMTASILIKYLISPFIVYENADSKKQKSIENAVEEITDIGILHVICSTPDIRNLYMKSSDYDRVQNFVQQESHVFLTKPKLDNKADYEWFLSEVKTAMLLNDWISEVPEKEILKRYDIGEGDIRTLSETAEWLAGAAARLANLLGSKIAPRLKDLEVRLKYGSEIELLSLLKIRNVGRVRARTLYKAGFKSKEDLEYADYEKVASLIGKKTAEKVLNSINNRNYETNNIRDFNRLLKKAPSELISGEKEESKILQKRFSDFL